MAVQDAGDKKLLISDDEVDDSLAIGKASHAGLQIVATDASQAKSGERPNLPLESENETVCGEGIAFGDMPILLDEIGPC